MPNAKRDADHSRPRASERHNLQSAERVKRLRNCRDT